MSNRRIDAQRARELLAAATPGPWGQDDACGHFEVHIYAPKGEPRLSMNYWESLVIVHGNEDQPRIGYQVAWGNADLICNAHDLAQTVVDLHAEVERAASAERGRIVAWLRAWADAYEPKYSVYPDDCRDLADRIERGEVKP